MNKNLAASLMVASVIVMGVFAGPRLLKAQQRQQSGPHVVVIKDVMHVVSPRLGGMKPIPPAYGVRKLLPLRHPMPLKSRLAPTPADPVLQTSTEPLVSTTSGLNFSGVGLGLGNFTDGYAPPDTNGSAGATQYVQWVNVDFAIFNKSTGALQYGPALGSTLFQALGGTCASTNSGDIIAQYDKQAQRWVMLQPVFSSPYSLCIAVSQTSDATGAYNEYQFSIPGNYFPDYPKLGVWPDGYYVSYNAFTSATGGFVSGYACALDRSAMLAGNSATMQCFNANGYPSLLPSDLDGDSGAPGTTAAPPAGAPNTFIDFSSTNSLNLFQFHVNWTNSNNSTFTGPTAIPVASFSEACGGGNCIPQEGTTQPLDSLGDRLMYRFAYRNFGSYQSWVVSQSVDTGSGNTGVRWYQLKDTGSGPQLYQQGTFAPDSNYRWMPSIAQDEAGDIALGYSVSSSSMYPGIRFTGRTPSDPLDTMETENSIVSGGGAEINTSNRWGDYSDMSVDPTNDCTFWYTTEYEQSTGSFNWSTQIASFTFPNCGSTSTTSFSLSATTSSQTITAGDSTSYNVDITPSGGYTGNVTLTAATSTGGLPAGMQANFSPNPADITGTSAVSSTLSVTTTSSTPAGTYNLTISGTDGTLTNSTQVSVVVQAPATPDFSLSSSPGSAMVTQGSSVKYTIAVSPSGGYTGTVNLSASGLPSGVTASFSPSSVSTSGGSVVDSTLTVSASGTASTGTVNFTVTGADSSGSPTHSISLGLTVQQVTSTDFILSVTPTSASAPQGSSAQYTITVAGSATGPFNGTVNLSVTGVPSRTSSSFSTTSIAGSGSSTLTVSPHHNAKSGTYSLQITGTSGSLSHSQTVTFIIGTSTTPDFSLTSSPTSQTAAPGSTANYTLTVSPSGGFNSSVSFNASGLPSGATPTFTPSSVTISSSSANSTLSVATSTSLAAGTYNFSVTASGGGVTHSIPLALVVSSPSGTGDFLISLSPSSQTIGPKSSATYTVTVSALNGFTGTVNLSVSGLPKRTSGSLSTTTTNASGTATLTISTTPKSPAGNYTVTVTGTSGSTSHSASASLTITP